MFGPLFDPAIPPCFNPNLSVAIIKWVKTVYCFMKLGTSSKDLHNFILTKLVLILWRIWATVKAQLIKANPKLGLKLLLEDWFRWSNQFGPLILFSPVYYFDPNFWLTFLPSFAKTGAQLLPSLGYFMN